MEWWKNWVKYKEDKRYFYKLLLTTEGYKIFIYNFHVMTEIIRLKCIGLTRTHFFWGKRHFNSCSHLFAQSPYQEKTALISIARSLNKFILNGVYCEACSAQATSRAAEMFWRSTSLQRPRQYIVSCYSRAENKYVFSKIHKSYPNRTVAISFLVIFLLKFVVPCPLALAEI